MKHQSYSTYKYVVALELPIPTGRVKPKLSTSCECTNTSLIV